jgi:hypothetical protein
LCACGQGYERVAGETLEYNDRNGETGLRYVKAMERRPPPAPLRAWAMLSLCWTAVLEDMTLVIGGEEVFRILFKDKRKSTRERGRERVQIYLIACLSVCLCDALKQGCHRALPFPHSLGS